MQLVQYNGTALRDPSFVATLPFDQNDVQRYIADRVLDRTRRRWTWFFAAREKDPSLGTLSHLPAEIRQHIWRSVLQCRKTLSSDGLWEYEATFGSVFRPSSYHFGFGRRPFADSKLENLRLVSATVKEEYDEVFFQQSFRFNQAVNLTKFLDRLTDPQLTQLVSVEIGVWMSYSIESWMEPLLRLPPTLREIHFRFYSTLPNWYETYMGQELVRLLRRLVQSVTIRLPNTRVVMSSTNEEPLSAQWHAVFDDIYETADGNGNKKETQLELRRRDARAKGVRGVLE
ncbi:hypothetical protein N7G274_007131 [Stereocaulon virgatum]|uniref:Uncharacterized protein n=1 Tax=Stereocaulon virgatum TaxID=373712 RepID=A0ABR4A3I6_9LECA